VVARLVGDAFFRHAALCYAHAWPSRSGNLDDVGQGFAGFLAAWSPAAGLPYLPDVARLEWACHEVSRAPDHPVGAAATPDADISRRPLRLHPACRVLESVYPILRVWDLNRPGQESDQTVDLREGGVRLLVLRREDRLEMQRLSAGEMALLGALDEGLDVRRAGERAVETEPGLDLAGCLATHLLRGALVVAQRVQPQIVLDPTPGRGVSSRAPRYI